MRNRTPLLAVLLGAAVAACQDPRDTPSAPATPPQLTPPSEAASAPRRTRTVEGYATPGEVRRGFIMGRNGEPLEITYEVHDDRAVWQGDMVLGPASTIPATRAGLEAMARRSGQPDAAQGVVINGIGFRWPGGIVPYVVHVNLPNPERVEIAMEIVERSTPGVTFVPRNTQTNYIRFVPGTGCSSDVGMVGGGQTILLTSDCEAGNAAHEILHALGMHHEQSRCDRDAFVLIQWDNIEDGKEDNFLRHCDAATDLYTYDEGSIMHYPADAFSRNGQPTIVSLRGRDDDMGQRVAPGPTDVQTIADLYGAFNDRPTAVIAPLAASYPEGTPVPFDGTGSSDPDDSHLNYRWNLGDLFCVENEFVCSQATRNHPYADDGTYPVKLRVSDGFLADEAETTVTVLNVAPVVLAGDDDEVDEGSEWTRHGAYEDPGEDSWTGSADYDDGAGALPLAVPMGGFNLRHTWPDNGTFDVTVVVEDDDGGVGDDVVRVTVNNVVPDVDAGPDATLTSGEMLELSGSFSDPGILDAPWSWTIDWGDRTIPTSGATSDMSAPILASHQVCTAGDYDVILNVRDKDGGLGSDLLHVTVPYLEAAVVIAPGGSPNAVNSGRNGLLPVAILGSADFDALDVDPATVVLGDEAGPDTPVARRNNGRWQARGEDVNRDGIMDMLLQFDVPTLVANGDLTENSTTLALRGFLGDACTNYRGTAPVVVRPGM